MQEAKAVGALLQQLERIQDQRVHWVVHLVLRAEVGEVGVHDAGDVLAEHLGARDLDGGAGGGRLEKKERKQVAQHQGNREAEKW